MSDNQPISDQPEPVEEYVLVRRSIVQRAVDEAIDGGRHFEVEAGLREALEPSE